MRRLDPMHPASIDYSYMDGRYFLGLAGWLCLLPLFLLVSFHAWISPSPFSHMEFIAVIELALIWQLRPYRKS